MGNILLQSGILIVIFICGYATKKIGILEENSYKVMTKLVMYFTLPCVIAMNFSKFEWNNSLLFLLVLGFSANMVLQLWAYVLSRKSNDMDKIFYMINMPGFSMGTFATPFVQNSLGVEGVVAACMFDAGGSFLQSGGSYVWTSAILKEKKNSEKMNALFVVKRLLSTPPFVTNIVMILLKIFDFGLPGVVLRFAEKVSDANAFLCMFMIGVMFEINFQRDKLAKVGKLLVSRIAVSAIFAIIIMTCIPIAEELRKALAIVIFSPITVLSLIFTDKMDGDIELAGFANSLSIVISMFVMTALMVLLT